MLHPDAQEWYSQFILTRDLVVPADRAAFFALVRRKRYVAIVRGVYVESDSWSSMDRAERHLTLVRAVAARDGGYHVFSHESAVALWRLPWVGAWPTSAHVLAEPAAGGRSNASTARHGVGVLHHTQQIGGLAVTPISRTVVDIARSATFAQAVVVADAALRRTTHPVEGVPRTTLTRSDLVDELRGVPLRRGSAKARAVIDFADGAADRPGESLSRVSMHRAGLPAPMLQVELYGASGKRYVVDFYWPGCRLVGEFDGAAKYSDPAFLRGRTPEQALLDEKAREDDLRAADYGVSRWGWDVATDPARLRSHLVKAGLHP